MQMSGPMSMLRHRCCVCWESYFVRKCEVRSSLMEQSKTLSQSTNRCLAFNTFFLFAQIDNYTRKSFILVLNCNGSEPDQISDLKTDSGTVLNLMFWARTCFGTYVRICIRLCSYLSQLCKSILNHLCHASELYHM